MLKLEGLVEIIKFSKMNNTETPILFVLIQQKQVKLNV
jgi:hypothetical protein